MNYRMSTLIIENPHFSSQTYKVYEYFNEWLFSNLDNKNNEESKKTIYCELFDVFHLKEFKATNDSRKNYHNCIGCNLEEGCLTILDFLEKFSKATNVSSYLTIYSLLFYSQAERLAVIYNELGYTIHDGFDWTRFPTLRSIKHWANFFKHPKAYMFLHHPCYFIESDPNIPNFMINGVIDNSFVEKYYRARADNTMLQQLFENGTKFKIIYPDLLELTIKMCAEFAAIIPVIKEEAHTQLLRKYTIDNFE